MERARRHPNERQLSLAYLIDVDALRRAYGRIRKAAAVGVDGVTKAQYGQDLETNLTDLHKRMKAMRYRHQPIRRVHITKDKSRKRPIGISCLEDKIVQGALTEVLGAIYEQDFLDSSFGFRRKRSAHDALKELYRAVRNAYDFCRRQRHKPTAVQHKALVSRIRGHFVYSGVNYNDKRLSALVYWATRAWYKWLNRRNQRTRLNWERFSGSLGFNFGGECNNCLCSGDPRNASDLSLHELSNDFRL
jgi:hypothetical protein